MLALCCLLRAVADGAASFRSWYVSIAAGHAIFTFGLPSR